jgi:hypothetical protein
MVQALGPKAGEIIRRHEFPYFPPRHRPPEEQFPGGETLVADDQRASHAKQQRGAVREDKHDLSHDQ